MGATDFIYKFDKGDEGFIDWIEFETFSKRYGCLIAPEEPNVLYDFKFINPIASIVSVHGQPSTGVSCISIGKPLENEFIRPFIFDALATFQMVFLYGDGYPFGYATNHLHDEIPNGLLSEGIRIVSSPNELFT